MPLSPRRTGAREPQLTLRILARVLWRLCPGCAQSCATRWGAVGWCSRRAGPPLPGRPRPVRVERPSGRTTWTGYVTCLAIGDTWVLATESRGQLYHRPRRLRRGHRAAAAGTRRSPGHLVANGPVALTAPIRDARCRGVTPWREWFPADRDRRRPAVVRTYAAPVEELGYRHILADDDALGADRTVHTGFKGSYYIDSIFHEPFVLFGFLAAITELEW